MERLTANDLLMLWPEDVGWPQDIGVLAILEGAPLHDSRGQLRIDDIRKQVGARLHLLPRFRQLLYRPRFRLGWPLWVDAPSFDLSRHIRAFPLEAPADEEQLLKACEELRRRRLDPTRPRWDMWLLPGLSGGRVGLFVRLHHSIADGVAGVASLAALFDLEGGKGRNLQARDLNEYGFHEGGERCKGQRRNGATKAEPALQPERPWAPTPIPSPAELLRDNARRRIRGLARKVSTLRHPLAAIQRARSEWPAVRELLTEERAPRTSLNARIGSNRRLALERGQLDAYKQIAHSHNAKVNDVLLAAVAGGLRELLQSRGEGVENVRLRAMVPVSLHNKRAGQAKGNLDGAMVVHLPVGEPDNVRRLHLITQETAERKTKPRRPGGAVFGPVFAQRLILGLMSNQRFVNLTVTNVPGPPFPLYFLGSRVLELFPLVPILGNISLGIGALSYAGQFNITAVADEERCPDIQVFVEGFRRCLAELNQSERKPISIG